MVAATCSLALAGCGGNNGDHGSDQLVVSAASSLETAFTDYVDATGIDAKQSFAGSDELAAQIRQGVKPDVYAAADTTLPAGPGPDPGGDREYAKEDRHELRSRGERRQRQPEGERPDRDAADADGLRVGPPDPAHASRDRRHVACLIRFLSHTPIPVRFRPTKRITSP